MRASLLLPLALGLLVAPVLLLPLPQLAGADVSYAVLSGSMEPTYHRGDLLLAKRVAPGGPLAVGDVITFRSEGNYVTHRILEVRGDGSARSYITQGDANAAPDPQPVPASAVASVVTGSVPFYGHLGALAAMPGGRYLLVAVLGAAVAVAQAAQLLAGRAKEAAAASAPAVPASPTPPPRASAPPTRRVPAAAPVARPPSAVVVRRPAARPAFQVVRK